MQNQKNVQRSKSRIAWLIVRAALLVTISSEAQAKSLGRLAVTPKVGFGSVRAGEISVQKDIVISNVGNAAVSAPIVSISNSAFVIVTNTCNAPLQIGDSCTVSVVFHPSKTGNQTARGSFVDDALHSPQHAALSGTGIGQPTVALIAGGIDGGCYCTAEIYDLRKGSFSSTGPMSIGRVGHTATMLQTGEVLLVGGSDSTVAELYVKSKHRFSPIGNTNTSRVNHTATLLPNGLVLIVGGIFGSYQNFESAELYDPKTKSFTFTAPMLDERSGHTATLLRNGKVLIAGGRRKSARWFYSDDFLVSGIV